MPQAGHWTWIAPRRLSAGGKSLLGAFFGQIEVADQPDQGGHDTAPIRSINCFNGCSCVNEHSLL